MSLLRLSVLAVPAAALLLATACSSGSEEPGPATGTPAAESGAPLRQAPEETPEDTFQEQGDIVVDVTLTYTSAASAEIGLHGLGVSPVSEDTASEFGSDKVWMDNATCTGTPDLVAFEASDPIGTAVSGQVSADGTGSFHIDQPDNPDHPAWLSVSNGPDQYGTWTWADGVITLDGITMSTVALDGWGSLSGEITCTVNEVA
ncbi:MULTISPECIES: hypothetical protein [unclassified Nocardiopsis]|uniref:hypothetical protein n=1 Tax=Nocardiopsis TaxID=2013 RepID=UPI00387AA157